VLDNRRNMVVRKVRVLLGKTALYRIDLCPLFLRHARHGRQRTGFSLRNNFILNRKLTSDTPHVTSRLDDRFTLAAGHALPRSSNSGSAAMLDVMAKAEPPPDINKIIDWLADYARRTATNRVLLLPCHHQEKVQYSRHQDA
jgi:hypothetical protein